MHCAIRLMRRNGAMLLPVLAMVMILCVVWRLIYIIRHIAGRKMGISRFYRMPHAGGRVYQLLVRQRLFSLLGSRLCSMTILSVPGRIRHYTHKACQIKISITATKTDAAGDDSQMWV